jgi:hypothetical protein
MLRALIMIISTALINTTEAHTLDKAREAYEKCVYSAKAGEVFLKETANEQQLTPVMKGYRGAVMMIMASHYFNPWAKLNSFNNGKLLLEAAIGEQPNDVELHYLRFAIQTNSPAFLGYTTHIKTDKEYLLKNLSKHENTIQRKKIAEYLLASKHLTEAEKSTIKPLQQ